MNPLQQIFAKSPTFSVFVPIICSEDKTGTKMTIDKNGIIMNKFKDRLNELLKEKDISQSDLRKQLNFSKNQVHYWTKGKAEPSLDDLIAIADFFGVCTDYLLGQQDVY